MGYSRILTLDNTWDLSIYIDIYIIYTLLYNDGHLMFIQRDFIYGIFIAGVLGKLPRV